MYGPLGTTFDILDDDDDELDELASWVLNETKQDVANRIFISVFNDDGEERVSFQISGDVKFVLTNGQNGVEITYL
jgi:hypothetical protein